MIKTSKVLIFLIMFTILFVPIVSSAAGLVPCGDTAGDLCGFNDFIVLAQNIINLITVVAFSVAVIMFSYAGVLYLTAGGKPSQIEDAHKIFTTVLLGLVFVFGAWLIVNTVASVLLNDSFFNGSFKFFFNSK